MLKGPELVLKGECLNCITKVVKGRTLFSPSDLNTSCPEQVIKGLSQSERIALHSLVAGCAMGGRYTQGMRVTALSMASSSPIKPIGVEADRAHPKKLIA